MNLNYDWIVNKIGSSTGLILYAHIDGLVQDCSNSIANALELLQSCIKSSMYGVRSCNTAITNDHFVHFLCTVLTWGYSLHIFKDFSSFIL